MVNLIELFYVIETYICLDCEWERITREEIIFILILSGVMFVIGLILFFLRRDDQKE